MPSSGFPTTSCECQLSADSCQVQTMGASRHPELERALGRRFSFLVSFWMQLTLSWPFKSIVRWQMITTGTCVETHGSEAPMLEMARESLVSSHVRNSLGQGCLRASPGRPKRRNAWDEEVLAQRKGSTESPCPILLCTN
jgi:hypothetical protein